MALIEGWTGKQGRRHDRFRSAITAHLIVDRKRLPVRLGNISAAGAMLRGRDLPPRGTEVLVRSPKLQIVATVIWSRGTLCGLKLHRQIEPLKVLGRRSGNR